MKEHQRKKRGVSGDKEITERGISNLLLGPREEILTGRWDDSTRRGGGGGGG